MAVAFLMEPAIQHISDSFLELHSVIDDDPGGSALEELCASSRLYQVDRSDVVSYARERVSWPKVESLPVPIGNCLPAGDSERLATWRQHMLKPSGSGVETSSVKKPYMDPILRFNHSEYEHFIVELKKRHMVSFKLDTADAGELGIFFVRKKNESQRLIFDTRILNEKFKVPPSTDLPSADAFTRLETPENEPFYIGSGDLSNAFYTLSVPDDLGQMFTLPAIEARAIGIDTINGHYLRPGTMICPYLTVLPMGWSWALHLCQCVMLHAIKQSGIDDEQIISDKGAPVCVKQFDDIACGGYVDNFVVIGNNPTAVDAGLGRISERLRSLGLTVHEEEPASLRMSFVGLDFNGQTGFVGLKPKRIHKLQKAIKELLARNFASGELLQLILGHITWTVMCRREGLSILKSCYAFVHEHLQSPCRLWPSVRFELETIGALLPLFRTKINVGWSSDVTASDSSPYGYGICSRKISNDIVQSIGSQCERWRFRFEDAIDARKHAAKSAGLVDLAKGQHKIDGHGIDDTDLAHGSLEDTISSSGFDEVPLKLLSPGDWTVVWSRPWNFKDNILHTEALALVWSIEHSLRSCRNVGKRLLFLSDNLPLTLSACKGRGKSGFLTKPLRKACALALATGSKLHVRWIPSEWNVADRPSRALSQWAARGLSSWFQDSDSEFSRSRRADRQHGVDENIGRTAGETAGGGVSERSLKRRKVVEDTHIIPDGMSYLEARSVRQPTIQDYSKRFNEFQQWVCIHKFTVVHPLDLDSIAVDFLQELFDANRGVNDGVRVIAALKFFLPHLARDLPRAARALKGWHLAAPPQQRKPMPLEVLGAVMGGFLAESETELALRLFIQFMTYLRPGECSQLLVKQLVAPQSAVNQTFGCWAILLHPMEDLIPGKTGIYDGSVILDFDLWINEYLARLVRGKDPTAPLWSLPHAAFREKFNSMVRRLNLEPLGLTLYALRHGGATHDVVARRRPMLEVKQRGRWSSDSSLKRYVKEAKLQADLAKVPESVKEFGMQIVQGLPQFLTNPLSVPKVPFGMIG
eukprot:s857_g6.t1